MLSHPVFEGTIAEDPLPITESEALESGVQALWSETECEIVICMEKCYIAGAKFWFQKFQNIFATPANCGSFGKQGYRYQCPYSCWKVLSTLFPFPNLNPKLLERDAAPTLNPKSYTRKPSNPLGMDIPSAPNIALNPERRFWAVHLRV